MNLDEEAAAAAQMNSYIDRYSVVARGADELVLSPLSLVQTPFNSNSG